MRDSVRWHELCSVFGSLAGPHSPQMRKILATELHPYRFLKKFTVCGKRRVGAQSHVKLRNRRVNTAYLFTAKTVLGPFPATGRSVLLHRERREAALFWRFCERMNRRICYQLLKLCRLRPFFPGKSLNLPSTRRIQASL